MTHSLSHELININRWLAAVDVVVGDDGWVYVLESIILILFDASNKSFQMSFLIIHFLINLIVIF